MSGIDNLVYQVAIRLLIKELFKKYIAFFCAAGLLTLLGVYFQFPVATYAGISISFTAFIFCFFKARRLVQGSKPALLIDEKLNLKGRATTIAELDSERKRQAPSQMVLAQLDKLTRSSNASAIVDLRPNRMFLITSIAGCAFWIAALIIFLQMNVTSYTQPEAKAIESLIKEQLALPEAVQEALQKLANSIERNGIDANESKQALQDAYSSVAQSQATTASSVESASASSNSSVNKTTPAAPSPTPTATPTSTPSSKNEKNQSSSSSSSVDVQNADQQKKDGQGSSSNSSEGSDGSGSQQSSDKSSKGQSGKGQDNKQGSSESGSNGSGEGSSNSSGKQGKSPGDGKDQKDQSSNGSSGSSGSSKSDQQQALSKAQEQLQKIEEKQNNQNQQNQSKDQKQQQGSAGSQSQSNGQKSSQGQSGSQQQGGSGANSSNQSKQTGSQSSASGNSSEANNKPDPNQKGQQPDQKGENASSASSDGKPNTDDGKSHGKEAQQKLDRNAKLKDLKEGDLGEEGPGVKGKKEYKDAQIKEQTDKFDERFAQDTNEKVEHKDTTAQPKTSLSEMKLGKPQASVEGSEQQIPLEYKDIIK